MEIIANGFKGLSDPTRLRILALLEEGELCVCDIIEVLDIPQSTISRHLAYLRKTAWVETRRIRKWMYYRRPAQSSPFQAYCFALLDEELAENDQARKDRTALMQRLADKTDDACSACA